MTFQRIEVTISAMLIEAKMGRQAIGSLNFDSIKMDKIDKLI
jgi:hypothetical protein